MKRNNMSALAMIAIILGAAGLGAGAYSVMSVQTGAVKGDDGDDGDDGTIGQKGDEGQDAPGDIVVGILDPDEGETVSGNVTIRAMIAGSGNYNIKVLINGSLNSTDVPFEWNTTKLADGWWNVTVIATDVVSNEVSQDYVIVYVKNKDTKDPVVYIISPYNGQILWDNITINAMILEDSAYTVKVLINASLNATYVPFEWNTTQVSDGWWNITVIITDNDGNSGQDTVIIYVDSTPYTGHVLQIQSVSRSDFLDLAGGPITLLSININVSAGSKIFCIATIGSVRLYHASYPSLAYDLYLLLDNSIVLVKTTLYRIAPQWFFECHTLHVLSDGLSEGLHNIKLNYVVHPGYPTDGRIHMNWDNSDTVLTVMEIGG